MVSKKVRVNILKAMTGKSNTISIASSCWLALLTAEPVDTNANNAPSYVEVPRQVASGGTNYDTGYTRTFLSPQNASDTQKIEVKCDATTQNIPTAINVDAIYTCECLQVPEIEHPWGTATYFGIFTSATGGELVAWGQILNESGEVTPITPASEQIPVIRKNQLKITIE